MTHPTPTNSAAELPVIQRFNNFAGIMNPESRGLYVRYEDYAAHIAALTAPRQVVPQGKVSRHSDMSVIVTFPSTRLASEFERALTAPQQEVPSPPECKTEAEKKAYAFGYWRGKEASRDAAPQQKLELPQSNDLDGALAAAAIVINSVLWRLERGISSGVVDAVQYAKETIRQAGEHARSNQAPQQEVQEPVATVFTMEAHTLGGGIRYHATIHKPLPAGTKLYTAPPPAPSIGAEGVDGFLVTKIIANLDAIHADYELSMGKGEPDAEMVQIVESTKRRLFSWWATNREIIRAAMAAQKGGA